MLLERDREVQLLAGLLAEVGSSGGKVILVRGEAGIGKTSLIREFIERHCDEAHVLLGFCDDRVTPQPLCPSSPCSHTVPAPVRQRAPTAGESGAILGVSSVRTTPPSTTERC